MDFTLAGITDSPLRNWPRELCNEKIGSPSNGSAAADRRRELSTAHFSRLIKPEIAIFFRDGRERAHFDFAPVGGRIKARAGGTSEIRRRAR